jgi:uncharacterized membrane protein YhhN
VNKQYWIFLFVVILVVCILGRVLQNPWIDYISKPLIILSLGGYFLSQTGTVKSGLKKWVLLALFFSWAGDVLLMFEGKDQLFFLAGLSAFLVAHLFYIVFFHLVRIKENVRGRIWLLLIVVLYYASLISFLSRYLNDMNLPVRIYGLVISFMYMLALHMTYIKNKRAGLWMMTGALLFLISDSVLAVNKFYQHFAGADLTIMLTYGLAQLFIVEGAVRYLTLPHKE